MDCYVCKETIKVESATTLAEALEQIGKTGAMKFLQNDPTLELGLVVKSTVGCRVVWLDVFLSYWVPPLSDTVIKLISIPS